MITKFKIYEVSKYDLNLFQELYDENPLKDNHDFYIFIAKYAFEEVEGGLYKKKLVIENMVRITPNEESINAINMLSLRAQFQNDSDLYHIWLPKEIRSEVEGKGSNIEPWIGELIDKYKMKGSDEHGKQVYRNVLQRRKDIEQYNL